MENQLLTVEKIRELKTNAEKEIEKVLSNLKKDIGDLSLQAEIRHVSDCYGVIPIVLINVSI